MYTYLPLSKESLNYKNEYSSSTLTSSGTTDAITKFRLVRFVIWLSNITNHFNHCLSIYKFYSTQREDTTKYNILIQEDLPNIKKQSNQPEKSLVDFSIKDITKTSANVSTTTSVTGEMKLNATTQTEINTTKSNSLITLSKF